MEKQQCQGQLLEALQKRIEAQETKAEVDRHKVEGMARTFAVDADEVPRSLDPDWDRAPSSSVLRLNTDLHVDRKELLAMLRNYNISWTRKHPRD